MLVCILGVIDLKIQFRSNLILKVLGITPHYCVNYLKQAKKNEV